MLWLFEMERLLLAWLLCLCLGLGSTVNLPCDFNGKIALPVHPFGGDEPLVVPLDLRAIRSSWHLDSVGPVSLSLSNRRNGRPTSSLCLHPARSSFPPWLGAADIVSTIRRTLWEPRSGATAVLIVYS